MQYIINLRCSLSLYALVLSEICLVYQALALPLILMIPGNFAVVQIFKTFVKCTTVLASLFRKSCGPFYFI